MFPILKRKTRKLYVDILIVFVSLFVITIATVISYMQYNQYQHSLDFSKRIVELNGTMITNDIDNYLKPAQVSELLDDLFTKGSLSMENPEHLGIFMEGILKSYPYMTSIYMVDNHGNFAQETHVLPGNTYTRKQITNRPVGTEYISYFLQMKNEQHPQHQETWIYKDVDGKVLSTQQLSEGDGYNPYQRPWYMGAEKANTKYWLNAYKFFGQKDVGLTVSYNIFDKNNKHIGVIATDYPVTALANFLDNTASFKTSDTKRPSKNAIRFIITAEDQLLVSSSNYHSNNLSNTNTSLENITQLRDQRINQAYRYFLQHQKNTFEFSYHGIRYLAFFKYFSYGGANKPWVMGMLAPLQDFMAPLQKAKNIASLISFVILLIGVLLIVFISRNISLPIVRLAREMDDIKNLKLDNVINLKTNIEENRTILNALNAMRASLKSFSSYVPKDLVAELINQGEMAKLGFKKRQLTVLFTDITGFSNISETISPEELTHLLTEYLQALSDIIKAHRGTVDKYTGDGLMAFWGAPSNDPEQARNACKASLLCQQKIHQLNTEWQSQGKPAFFTRMGIDMGTTLVGNLGSNERMNYTAIGETVNLAAYLESLNKQYHTEIIVSDAIYQQCLGEFSFAPLGSITAKGSERIVNLYELLAIKDGQIQSALDQEKPPLITIKPIYLQDNSQK